MFVFKTSSLSCSALLEITSEERLLVIIQLLLQFYLLSTKAAVVVIKDNQLVEKDDAHLSSS